MTKLAILIICLLTITYTNFSQSKVLGRPSNAEEVKIDSISDKMELVTAFENVKKVKIARLISKLNINDVNEDMTIDFVAPNKYYQRIKREKNNLITELESLQIATKVYAKSGKNWTKETEVFVTPKDNFHTVRMPRFRDEKGKVADDELFSVKFIGEESLNNQKVRVFEYTMQGMLPTKGKVWVKEGLPVQFEFATLPGCRNTIVSRLIYEYSREIASDFPKMK